MTDVAQTPAAATVPAAAPEAAHAAAPEMPQHDAGTGAQSSATEVVAAGTEEGAADSSKNSDD